MYIAFGDGAGIRSGDCEKWQNALLGISIKKSIAFIGILFAVFAISLVLKALLIGYGSLEYESLHFQLLSGGICISLMIAFLFYFIGDIHDVLAGKGVSAGGRIYFSSRTRLKDVMFRIGDVLKFVILLGGLCISLAVLFNAKGEIVLLVNLIKMWLVYAISASMSKVRFQRSYISRLLTAVSVAVFTIS